MNSATFSQAITVLTGVRLDVRRAGAGLICYALVLLAASIPVVVSGSPAGLVSIAICLGYAGSGLGLVRRYAWAQRVLMLSCTMHVGLAVGWFMLLTSI